MGETIFQNVTGRLFSHCRNRLHENGRVRHSFQFACNCPVLMRRLTTLWAFMACYRDVFAFYHEMIPNAN
jgi:hypothetical protein